MGLCMIGIIWLLQRIFIYPQLIVKAKVIATCLGNATNLILRAGSLIRRRNTALEDRQCVVNGDVFGATIIKGKASRNFEEDVFKDLISIIFLSNIIKRKPG